MEQGIKKQSAPAVETISLSKIYNGKAAVSHLDMKVQEGAIYGFIGRNGAGKSTTLKMLCGLARPTEGEIRLFGKSTDDPICARRMGCLIESAGLYPHMTARQNAVMKAKCMGLTDPEAVDRVLEATGMNNTGKKKAKLEFEVSEEFTIGDCRKCPISYIDNNGSQSVYECPLKMRGSCGIQLL